MKMRCSHFSQDPDFRGISNNSVELLVPFISLWRGRSATLHGAQNEAPVRDPGARRGDSLYALAGLITAES
jgi:hypothetical protein